MVWWQKWSEKSTQQSDAYLLRSGAKDTQFIKLNILLIFLIPVSREGGDPAVPETLSPEQLLRGLRCSAAQNSHPTRAPSVDGNPQITSRERRLQFDRRAHSPVHRRWVSYLSIVCCTREWYGVYSNLEVSLLLVSLRVSRVSLLRSLLFPFRSSPLLAYVLVSKHQN